MNPPKRCPTCNKTYNACLWPESMEFPDEGEFCMNNGYVFVHEELIYYND